MHAAGKDSGIRGGVCQTHTRGPARSLQHALPSIRTGTFTMILTKEGAPVASVLPPPRSLARPVQGRRPAGRNFGRGTPCEPGWRAGPPGGGCPGAALAQAPVHPQTGLGRLPGAPMQQLHGRNKGWREGFSPRVVSPALTEHMQDSAVGAGAALRLQCKAPSVILHVSSLKPLPELVQAGQAAVELCPKSAAGGVQPCGCQPPPVLAAATFCRSISRSTSGVTAW